MYLVSVAFTFKETRPFYYLFVRIPSFRNTYPTCSVRIADKYITYLGISACLCLISKKCRRKGMVDIFPTRMNKLQTN